MVLVSRLFIGSNSGLYGFVFIDGQDEKTCDLLFCYMSLVTVVRDSVTTRTRHACVSIIAHHVLAFRLVAFRRLSPHMPRK